MTTSSPIALLLTISHVTSRKMNTMKKLSRSISLLKTFDGKTSFLCASVKSISIVNNCRSYHQCTSITNKLAVIDNHQYTTRRMASKSSEPETPMIALCEVRRFMIDCFTAVGTPEKHAEEMADLLVEADYRGHFSHGMNRLEMYIKDIEGKTCDACATPIILKESPATAWVDGKNGLGAVVGNFCMDVAIKKAKEVGVGWVCAKGSNHYGIAGWYSLSALKQNVLGFSCTNTSPLMSPTRSIGAALGTNPLALGAPGKCGDSFVLDMATTAVAVGKIEIKRRKGEKLPPGWAQDDKGKITDDPEVAIKAGCLMPLGGGEINSGYKGYGLGLLVETFCGILAGAHFGPFIRKWTNPVGDADLGQCFIAIDQECFAPGFEDRMTKMMDYLRKMPTVDSCNPVLVPGDPERHHMAKVDKEGGVRYTPNQMKTCEDLAKRLKICSLQPLCC